MSIVDLVDGFVFDLDGTVYLGNAALPNAPQTIAALRQMGKRTLFVSNKPLEPRQSYAQKLTRLGIPTPDDDVITSTFVLGRYLTQHHPDLRCYVVGEPKTRAELAGYGIRVLGELEDQDPKDVLDPSGIDAVIVAFDRTLDYRKLNTAYQALKRGAKFFATNGDKTCPMPGGDIPDAGATLAALEHISGRSPDLLAGKPSTLILEVAVQWMGLPPARCIMIGDRLETDMRMGRQAGMLTAVTLTGVTGRDDVALMPDPPDYVIETLGDLLEM
jgi:arabinose operon protein AraL